MTLAHMMGERDKTMSTTPNTATSSTGINIRGLLSSIVLNAGIPLALYLLVKRYVSPSDVVALSVAAIFPILSSIFDFVRHRQFDLIAIFALLGIIVSVGGVLLGGNSKILLIRESFFTVMLGIACFVSLLLPRPLMFYVGRQFIAGKDPEKIAEFNAQWQRPYARFVHRLITSVWGIAYVGEFIIRVILVYTLPAAFVLALSPILLGGITIGTITWTFAYVRHARRRGAELAQRQQQAGITSTK
jgi:hypothetical protein